MKKRLVSLFLALALCLGLCVPALAFTDVPGDHYAYAAIMDCSERGVVGGYSDGTFQPGKTVSKNHFCAMLARAFYPDRIATYDKDQYKDAYGAFAPTNIALAHHNILNNTSFCWHYSESSIMSAGINRYDMAQLMANILSQRGFSVSESEQAAAAKITNYGNVPEQYRAAVASVYALGMIGGYSDGAFHGEGVMNRGQAAAVIYRMIQLCGNAPETPPETEKPGTGGPETPETPETAEKPETPVQSAGRTLANGQPITEENVTAILNQLKSRYPNGTSFVNGYGGLGSGRNPYSNCIAQIVSTYRTATGIRCSTQTGCGRWAAFVADEIWGQTGVTWKKTIMENARPGDLLIDVDANGYLTHVSIFVGPVNGYPVTKRIYTTDAVSGKNGYGLGWNMTATSTAIIDVYTAYPN